MEEPMAHPKNNPKLPIASGEKAGPKVIQRWSAGAKALASMDAGLKERADDDPLKPVSTPLTSGSAS